MFSFISCQKKQLNQVVFLKKNQDVGLYREPEYLKKVQLKLGDLQVNEIQEKLNFRDELLINASISVFEKGKLRTYTRTDYDGVGSEAFLKSDFTNGDLIERITWLVRNGYF